MCSGFSTAAEGCRASTQQYAAPQRYKFPAVVTASFSALAPAAGAPTISVAAMSLPYTLTTELRSGGRSAVVVTVHVKETAQLSAELIDSDVLSISRTDSVQLLEVKLPAHVDPETAEVILKRKAGTLTFKALELPSAGSKDSLCNEVAAPRQQEEGDEEVEDLQLLREMYGAEVVSLPSCQPAQRVQNSTASVAAYAASDMDCTRVQRDQEAGFHDMPALETVDAPACTNNAMHGTQAQIAPQHTNQAARSTAPVAASMQSMTLTPDSPVPSGPAAEAPALDCSNLALLLSKTTQKAHRDSNASAKKSAKADKKTAANMLHAIADHLEKYSWAVCDGYVPLDMVIEVRKELKVMEDHYTAGEIWVGKEADVGATITRRDVRGDRVIWLDQEALNATSFVVGGVQRKCCFRTLNTVMKSIDLLVTGRLPELAPQLKNVKERSDTMCAIYPGQGTRFAKHIDNTADDGRRLTMVCYLNPNWKDHNGGALRLFPPNAAPVDVYPRAGRMAMFLSKTVAHEVMPTAVPRHSFTLWYYDALERAESIANARVAAGGAASAAAQAAARDLMRDILAGDTGAEGALQADEDGVKAFQLRVRCMDPKHRDHALTILASITGLASAEAFQQSIDAMTPSDLSQLRDALWHMGLDHTPSV